MKRNEEIVDAAVEAACKQVWNRMHRAKGPWPDACPAPARWRREERDALIPALRVLEEAGVLKWD